MSLVYELLLSILFCRFRSLNSARVAPELPASVSKKPSTSTRVSVDLNLRRLDKHQQRGSYSTRRRSKGPKYRRSCSAEVDSTCSISRSSFAEEADATCASGKCGKLPESQRNLLVQKMGVYFPQETEIFLIIRKHIQLHRLGELFTVFIGIASISKKQIAHCKNREVAGIG